MFKLVDGVLQLVIKYGAVGHHNHRVKQLLALVVVERRQLVGGPGDGVGLTRARAMLGQVLLARAFLTAGRHQPIDQIPLVIARKDQALLSSFLSLPVLLTADLQVDETADDLQQVSRGQHLVPEIVRGVAVAVLGGIVARTALCCPPVKRQKARGIPRQSRGHVRLVLAHRKVDQRPPLKGQQRLRLVGCRVFGQAGFLVLLNGVLHRLLEFALQLQGDNGNAVQKQHQVDTPRLGLGAGFLKMGLGGIGAVDQLRHHPQNIARVHRLGIRVQAMVGFELAELKSGGFVAQLVA